MTFSYTQVSQYLRCPRSYRFRYLDGWREKESRAALCFGRCFEKAVAAFFEREDAGAVLFKEWGTYRDVPLEFARDKRQRVCGLCGCHWLPGRQSAFARMENHQRPLPGATRRTNIAGPPVGLLLLDPWDVRRRHCRFREETCPGDSISAGFDHRRAASRVWPAG